MLLISTMRNTTGCFAAAFANPQAFHTQYAQVELEGATSLVYVTGGLSLIA
jgi:hypothetical protein